MSYSISTLLTRNLDDVFGENDPARRRAAIDEIFTEDCVFYEPKGVHRGRDEIDRIAGGFNGYLAALVRRQLTPGLISSLLETGGLPPFISFSTSYNSYFTAHQHTVTRSRREVCRAVRATDSRSRRPVGVRVLAELGFAVALHSRSGRSEMS